MSKAKLKPINEQVIVITGASSGIGLATALLAAERGAIVVMSARNEEASKEIVAQITAKGGTAIFVPCDVSERDQVEQLANAAIENFGRIDTWVNNAGQGMYGLLDEVSEEDSRRLFDINFWGIYNGSLTVVPLQGMYSTTKHAVKGIYRRVASRD